MSGGYAGVLSHFRYAAVDSALWGHGGWFRVVDQKQYAEQLVDNVVAQKNAEVVAYKKQLQINREMVARQAAAQRAASQKRAAPPPARKPPS